MTFQTLHYAAWVVVVCFGTISCQVSGQAVASIEYKVEQVERPTPHGLELRLNALAREGWELDQITMIDSPSVRDYQIILRRPVGRVRR